MQFKDKVLTYRDNELKNKKRDLDREIERKAKVYKTILYEAYHGTEK